MTTPTTTMLSIYNPITQRWEDLCPGTGDFREDQRIVHDALSALAERQGAVQND